MARAKRAAALIAAIVCGALFAHGSDARAELLAGTAMRELIPPVKVPLAGYSKRKGKLATGVHDAPAVRALVVREGDRWVAMASCDLLIIDEQLFDAVRKKVAASSAHEPIALLVAATHTHSGPGAYGHKFFEKLSMGHFDRRAFDFLVEQIAGAIVDATSSLQPVTVRAATAAVEGVSINRVIDGGPVDRDLTVVSFDGAAGKPVAVIVNFAAHPTSLGAWNMQFSADYPGLLVRAIEQRHPNSRCLFFAGAVGDQAPIKRGDRYDRPHAIADPLIAKAMELVDDSHASASSGLRAVTTVMRLPPPHLHLPRFSLPSWLSRPFVDDDATLTLVAIGSVVFIGVPCDLSAELGFAIKRHAASLGYTPLIVGFADDYVGYCMPEHIYRSGGYEASMAFNGPKTGELLVERVSQLLDELGPAR